MKRKILAQAKGYKLSQDIKTGQLYYWYDVSKYAGTDMIFEFSLLCEVGQPYQRWFLEHLHRFNIKPVSVETDTDYFEVSEDYMHLYQEAA